MKNAVTTLAVLLLSASLVSACKAKETQQQGTSESTETIAPASAKPLPTGNEAMTQTVDVEGGSSGEGGASASTETPTTMGTTATVATTTAPATGQAAVVKGKNAPGVPRNRTQ